MKKGTRTWTTTMQAMEKGTKRMQAMEKEAMKKGTKRIIRAPFNSFSISKPPSTPPFASNSSPRGDPFLTV